MNQDPRDTSSGTQPTDALKYPGPPVQSPQQPMSPPSAPPLGPSKYRGQHTGLPDVTTAPLHPQDTP